ncbi:RelA/SpoT domain-containing protein [Phyllobacterium sp. BT25]|uniref:RelA/SpoT domain-containing protein n=2 Tax=Phyllobacterium pellucidum TaxID=2740464 RepID=A0A849VN31_9HYPH|nr:RelA/SpoT domain-containing protein [Phyllobacterium pellucidum]NTS31241.1 RelA/SpoT domain-containing protein [Phyllobacterium pellucidum]
MAFPGGSKKNVTRSGDIVRDRVKNTEPDWVIEPGKVIAFWEARGVIDDWRAAHRHILNTFQAFLRNRTRGTKIVVAQRHKRLKTIIDKLQRFPTMQLARMDDVAGCRLIFPTVEELYVFREQIHAARIQHRRKNDVDKYDYIKSPKSTGYRGIHDVYEYNARSTLGAPYKGLLIELQYRTIYQHAWATCVEVVGFITESQPKFERGDDRYGTILQYASELIAREYEKRNSCVPELSNRELVDAFLKLDDELNFMSMLRGIHAVDRDIDARKNVILIFSDKEPLRTISFENSSDAVRKLFSLEKEIDITKDVVLVRADTGDEVRDAFRNYFSDAREFIRYVETACNNLMRDDFAFVFVPSEAEDDLEAQDEAFENEGFKF